jgi:hypothetical protein
MGINNSKPFMVGYSNSKKLGHLNNSSCEVSIEKTKLFLEKIIRKLSKIQNFEKTEDYAKYNLYPGQQIRRWSKKGVPHTGIYIYEGLIIEMGSGPKKCARKLGNIKDIKQNINGLTTLKQFKQNSKTAQIIVTDSDSDKKIIISRLERAMSVVGKSEYNYLTSNCFHMANYVSHDSKKLLSIKNLRHKNLLDKRRSKKKTMY